MGVKDLFKLITHYAPEAYVTTDINYFRGKTVAFDGHQILIRLLKASGGIDFALEGFMRYVDMFTQVGAKVICIFDGDGENVAKENEHIQRHKRTEKDRIQLAYVETDIRTMTNKLRHRFNISNEEVISTLMSISIRNTSPRSRAITALRCVKTHMPTVYNDFVKTDAMFSPILEELGSLIIQKNKLDSRLAYMSSDNVDRLMMFLSDSGITCISAYSEADFIVNNMSKHGRIDAVFSADSDMLTHFAPILIRGISKGRCETVFLNRLLEILELVYEEFVDLCILLGTDYNNRLYRHGIKLAYRNIQKYKTLDNVLKQYAGGEITEFQNNARVIYLNNDDDYIYMNMDVVDVIKVSPPDNKFTHKMNIYFKRINTYLVDHNASMYMPCIE